LSKTFRSNNVIAQKARIPAELVNLREVRPDLATEFLRDDVGGQF
jgi:hypothetical protein